MLIVGSPTGRKWRNGPIMGWIWNGVSTTGWTTRCLRLGKRSRELRERRVPHGGAAGELAQQAEVEYLEFIDDHRWEFVAEIEDRARKVSADWRRLNDETRKRLTPLEREHRDLRSAVSFFLGNTEALTRDDIPEDYAQPPLPTADALARLEAAQPAQAVHRAHKLAT
jgi:hypothetical protein